MFKNRAEAAMMLADQLLDQNWHDVVVVALPRGGVPLGAVIARRLKAPLALVIPRKIGDPQHNEYALGAITETGEFIINPEEPGVLSEPWFNDVVAKEIAEAKRRRSVYTDDEVEKEMRNKQVILVDDGMVTGLTMRAAIQSIRKRKPKSITVAIPVAPPEVIAEISKHVDQVVCLVSPRIFLSVGAHYKEFPQVTDDEVISILQKSK